MNCVQGRSAFSWRAGKRDPKTFSLAAHNQELVLYGVIRWKSARATLASIVAKARPGIRFNEHIEGDGPTVFAHACKMGS